MFKKNKFPSPLALHTKEFEELKKKINKLVSISNVEIKKKTIDEIKIDSTYKELKELFNNLNELEKKVEDLKEEDEPASIAKYENKKKAFLFQINEFQSKTKNDLEKIPISDKLRIELEKNEISDEDDRSIENIDENDKDNMKQENVDIKDEDNYDDDHNDDSEDDEESDADAGTSVVDEKLQLKMEKYIGLEDFKAELAEDLGFKKGEVLTIIKINDDGWLEAMNKNGDKGLVPINYLKKCVSTPENNSDNDDDSDEDNLSEKTDNIKQSENLKDKEKSLNDEELPNNDTSLDDDDQNNDDDDDDGDLDIKEKESQSEEEQETLKTIKNKKSPWNQVKKAISEPTLNDVINAFADLPSGYRESTLTKLMQTEYSLKNFLIPKLSKSSILYDDLYMDNKTNEIRVSSMPIQLVINLMSVSQIPLIKEDKEIISRHARVCLFDGQEILSNILFIRVSSVDKTQRTWFFSNESKSLCIDFGEFFVRCNQNKPNIGVLCELCLTYKKKDSVKEIEVSCGWVFLKLFDSRGIQIQKGTFEEIVNGGTPYEKGVPIELAVTANKNANNILRNLMNLKKDTKLWLKVSAPTKDQNKLLETLPEVIIANTTFILYMSYYRQILCDVLLRDRLDKLSTEIIYSPMLKNFPSVFEQPDLMDILRAAWAEKVKTLKRFEMDNLESMKKLFETVFLDSVYPFLHIANLPGLLLHSPSCLQARSKEINKVLECNVNSKQNIGANVFSKSDILWKPFDVNELAFSVIPVHQG